MIHASRHLLRWLLALLTAVGVGAFLLVCAALVFVVTGMSGNAVLPADCALVFGAAVAGYDQPGPAMTRRVSTAARLYRDGSVQTLIMSGGVGRGEGVSLSEAEVMRRQAEDLGVKLSNILTESGSHSTGENLQNSRFIASECQNVVGISDGYHLARIRLLASRMGWHDLTVLPADARPAFFSELQSIGREVVGVLYYGLWMDYVFDINVSVEQEPLAFTF